MHNRFICENCGCGFPGQGPSHPNRYCCRACYLNRRGALEDYFWSQVIKTDSCWLWKGGITSEGYGEFFFNGHRYSTHRLAWELTNGTIHDGLWVLHRCESLYQPGDTSYRRCVKPSINGEVGHLYLGTIVENTEDLLSSGRIAKGERSSSILHPEALRRGESHPNAKLTTSDVLRIREAFAAGESAREIADRYGVHRGHVIHIVRRHLWKHVGAPAETVPA